MLRTIRRWLRAWFRRKPVSEEDEWEKYPEPLFDPARSEVRLLLKEYFDKADAERERKDP